MRSYDVVHVVYNVVLMVVMVDICCGCDDCVHGKLMEVKWWFLDGLCCFSCPCSELQLAITLSVLRLKLWGLVFWKAYVMPYHFRVLSFRICSAENLLY